MSLNLNKKVFKKLEGGDYSIKVIDWKLDSKVTKKGEVWEHVNLSVVLNDNREYNILWSEVSLDINCNKVLETYNMEEGTDQVTILNWMKGRTFEGYLEEKVVDGTSFYNWYLVRNI